MVSVVGLVGAYFALVVMVVSSVLVNALQALTYALLVVSPTSRLALRQWLANSWWNLFLFVVEVWGGVRYRYFGDRLRAGGSENAIMISNHERGLDFVNGVNVASRVEGLGCGRVMSMMKDSLKWLPTIGWTNWLQGSLYLKRDWARDRGVILQKLKDMETGAFPRPFFVGVYPEGTRITPKKHEASIKFARERGLPELQNVLLPRTKGFVFLKEHLPTSISCVYDVTVAYEGGPAYLGHALVGGRFRCEGIHVHVRRVPFDELPSDPKELEKWLLDAFVAKDRLLQHHKEHGTFPGDPVEYPAPFVGFWRLFAVWSAVTAAVVVAASGFSPVAAVTCVAGAAAALVPSGRRLGVLGGGGSDGGDGGKKVR